MKILGDASEEDKKLAEELSKFEKMLDSDDTFSKDIKAQSYVCIAHDWYQLNMDEEGNRLLIKAEKTYPGYFKTKISEHIEEDGDFKKLVKNITIELLYLFAQFKDKQ